MSRQPGYGQSPLRYARGWVRCVPHKPLDRALQRLDLIVEIRCEVGRRPGTALYRGEEPGHDERIGVLTSEPLVDVDLIKTQSRL